MFTHSLGDCVGQNLLWIGALPSQPQPRQHQLESATADSTKHFFSSGCQERLPLKAKKTNQPNKQTKKTLSRVVLLTADSGAAGTAPAQRTAPLETRSVHAGTHQTASIRLATWHRPASSRELFS